MEMIAHGTDDLRKFSPARDVRFAFRVAVTAVCRHFNEADTYSWEDLKKLADNYDVTHDDLCDTMDCLCQFINNILADPEESMHQVLERSGFLKQPPAAQIVLMAMFGRIYLGQFFDGLRSNTPLGEEPQDITELLTMVSDSLNTARRPNMLSRFFRRLARLFS